MTEANAEPKPAPKCEPWCVEHGHTPECEPWCVEHGHNGCQAAPQDAEPRVKSMVVSWQVEHYRVKGLEVMPTFETHLYDPVVMLQCRYCVADYGAEKIATVPRHRESLESEILALRDRLAAAEKRVEELERAAINEWMCGR